MLAMPQSLFSHGYSSANLEPIGSVVEISSLILSKLLI